MPGVSDDPDAPLGEPSAAIWREHPARIRLYDWEVRTGLDGDLSACGVTDTPGRARARMLEALVAQPEGAETRGSVTVVQLGLARQSYQRCCTLMVAGRDVHGLLHWMFPAPGAKALAYADQILGGRTAPIERRKAQQ